MSEATGCAPGVAVAITKLAFTNSLATVSFTLTDGAGAGVDPLGKLTTTPVALGVVLAQLALDPDGSPGSCTAYATTIDAVAAALTGIDRAITQTVAVLAVRGDAKSRAIPSARPDGGANAARELVTVPPRPPPPHPITKHVRAATSRTRRS